MKFGKKIKKYKSILKIVVGLLIIGLIFVFIGLEVRGLFGTVLALAGATLCVGVIFGGLGGEFIGAFVGATFGIFSSWFAAWSCGAVIGLLIGVLVGISIGGGVGYLVGRWSEKKKIEINISNG